MMSINVVSPLETPANFFNEVIYNNNNTTTSQADVIRIITKSNQNSTLGLRLLLNWIMVWDWELHFGVLVSQVETETWTKTVPLFFCMLMLSYSFIVSYRVNWKPKLLTIATTKIKQLVSIFSHFRFCLAHVSLRWPVVIPIISL